jgi:hypothetical protein
LDPPAVLESPHSYPIRRRGLENKGGLIKLEEKI